jgi:hypothetical protein
MVNNNLNFFNDLSKLNNIKSKSCDFFNNIPIIIWIILGIIFIYLLYSFFNSNKILYNNNSYQEAFDDSSNETVQSHVNSINIYNFNTKWCHWSNKFRPEWDIFTQYIDKINQENSFINIKTHDIDCDDPVNKELISNYDIPGFPSIIFELPNKQIHIYEGERSVDKLLEKLDDILSTNN